MGKAKEKEIKLDEIETEELENEVVEENETTEIEETEEVEDNEEATGIDDEISEIDFASRGFESMNAAYEYAKSDFFKKLGKEEQDEFNEWLKK